MLDGQIQESLDKLQELDDGELTDLEGKILAQFDEAEKSEPTQETVELMTKFADAIDAIRAETERRSRKKQELQQVKNETAARVRGNQEGGGEGETPAEGGESTPPPAPPAEGGESTPPPAPPAPSGEEEEKKSEEEKSTPASTTAAVSSKNSSGSVPSSSTGIHPEGAFAIKPQPVVAPPSERPNLKVKESEAMQTITAGADIPGVAAGSPLDNMDAVSRAFVQRMHALRRTSGGDGEQHAVATLVTEYPEERTLRGNEGANNWDKVQSVVSPQAITASGGLCAPLEVRYEVFGLGVTDRPVKDSLPSFNADRGGIQYVTPPTLDDVDGAVRIWTITDDEAAASGVPPLKPCIAVSCGVEVRETIDAIPLCLTFGNMGARAYPELVSRHNELGLIWHARYAEMRLLTRIGRLSTQTYTQQVISAARDFFVQVEKGAAGYRSRHRLASNFPLRLIAPYWFRNLIRADLVMQIPGDGLGASFELTEATIESWFKLRNINVTWSLDGETDAGFNGSYGNLTPPPPAPVPVTPPQLPGSVVDAPGGSNYLEQTGEGTLDAWQGSTQIFGMQDNGQPLLSFPGELIWYLFAEGTFLFLDGGTLDLGLVRDSTLNSTNDYRMFIESFEGVAKVGVGFGGFRVEYDGLAVAGDRLVLRRGELGTQRKRPRWLEFVVGPGKLATEVRGIDRSDRGVVVHGRSDAGDRRFEADIAVHGAGRIPDLDDLDLGRAGVAHDRRGITVNQYLQSVSNPAVYAAGDAAASGPPLTPKAGQDSEVVAQNLLEGNRRTPDYRAIASAVFTVPSLAAVGHTEATARARGLRFRSRWEDTSSWLSSRRLGETASGYKVLVDEGSGRVLGAHLLGPHAAVFSDVAAPRAFAVPCPETSP
jgi:hypothetical protein